MKLYIYKEGYYLQQDELMKKPYVVYGYAIVAENQTLTIEAGCRVSFHEDSGLHVAEGASLYLSGRLSQDQDPFENTVIFEGDRLEPRYGNSRSMERYLDH
ncbi:hypothetical protein [Maribacter polysaccharolyticus]|uniref:hypothetical protein n=1 Tax=Maribacter polysaccharolyticus TaxID=3020831 RepID=UPI00237F6D79|nr:hypothetical protein [Maribacter polysaccharolyticus]MDE3740623.1 hypothetical protein [Maribacter polysaccharolyticus]